MCRYASSINVVDHRFRDRVGVVADVVLVAIAILADVIGQDGAPILQMNRVGPRHGTGQGDPCPDAEKRDISLHSGAF